ncbi:MAG: alpha-glucoside transport system permease protein [Gaiellales bacterium]|nr:alpha-glucoside transport system permease protein [Gaiellales bacterium]
MSGSGAVAGQPPVAPPPPEAVGEPGGLRKYALAGGFLLPAAVLLGVWVVYPTIRTIIRSFYDRSGSNFVWFDNYQEIFTSDILVTAVKNNLLWVAVVPALVASIGLVFAVLMERVSWAVAFRTAVFMPMAISAFAAGITWRIVYQQDPNLGVANAAIKSVHDVFISSGVLSKANPSTDNLVQKGGGIELKDPVAPGDVAKLGLTAIPPADVPDGAVEAKTPEPLQGGITGVVWRDFKPGGGTPGEVEPEELGLPGVKVDLLDASGSKVGSATTANDGTFSFADVGSGDHKVAIAPSTFAKPFGGIDWLGERLITPAVMIAYLWIWAGFAMVVIAAGLAAIPRDVLEAARTDGANEFQVFRRVTVPLLAPVLTVVFVTMLINVLKVFDIVISVAPGSSQDDATVLALAMWRTAFGGSNDFGVGSAIAVLIFVLVVPVLMLNIRRFRQEA